MKIECPVCGTEGHLQQRGSSFRIQHYKGFIDGKRKYIYHKPDPAYLEVNEVNHWK